MNLLVPKNFRLLLCLILAGVWPASMLAKQGISNKPATVYLKKPIVRPSLAGRTLLLEDQDQRLVLQRCLDLKTLQAYYPKSGNGEYRQVYVLQHGVSFPTDIAVSAGGKPLAFLDKSQLGSGKIEAYFLFYEFALAGNTARVDFVYNYDQTSTLKKMLVVSLELQKTGSDWTIVQQKTEERES